MSQSAKDLYIELLKNALIGTIYDEPPVPVETYWLSRGPVKQKLARAISSIFNLFGARLCFSANRSSEEIRRGLVWSSQAHTMIGRMRMDNLSYCLETVLKESIPGDLIETGVWRGGACILMRGILAAYGDQNRTVYVADSFRGLPPPNAAAYPADSGDQHHIRSFLAVSQEQVRSNFSRYGLLDSQVVFLEGWFKDTLPKLPSKPFSVIRLDGDMYESTVDALSNLYPKLSPGGFCIIDDYALENCAKAVHDYRKQNSIVEPIHEIDGVGVYWRKQLAGAARA